MKKLLTKMKMSVSILILLTISFSFFAFSDYGHYSIEGKIIKRGVDKMYQVGVINVKFKAQVTGFTKNSMGISGVDKVLSELRVERYKTITSTLRKFQKKNDW